MLDQTINHLNEILTIQQTTDQLMEVLNLRAELDKTLSAFAQELDELNARVINEVPENISVRVVPASTLPWPSIDLVPEWTIRSAPH